MKGILHLVVAITLCAASLPAQSFDLIKLTANEGSKSDEFGISVAISNDHAVAGAHRDRPSGSYSGSAYVFKRSGSGWQQQAKLIASDTDSYSQFGWAVAISGTYIIIGAKGDRHGGKDAGSAYLFRFDGIRWSEEIKLVKSEAVRDDEFGHAVAIDGAYAIVGAPGDDDGRGSAYLYHRKNSGWTKQAELRASDGEAGFRFGLAVAIDSDIAMVGAPGGDGLKESSGVVYVFRRQTNNWQEVAKLAANDGSPQDEFGQSLSLSHNRVVVGAPMNDDRGDDSGSAYLFSYDGNSWQQKSKLLAEDGSAGDHFGSAVALSGDRLIIGAYHDDDNGSNSGSAYLFKRTGNDWLLHAKVKPQDGAAEDMFGISVAMDENHTLLGAYLDDEMDENTGSAYLLNGTATLGVNGAAQPSTPKDFELAQNYPNPFFGKHSTASRMSQHTTIKYELSSSSEVELIIYNQAGQLVRTLVSARQEPGIYQVSWDGRNEGGVEVPAGVYAYRLSTRSFVQIRKLIYLH